MKKKDGSEQLVADPFAAKAVETFHQSISKGLVFVADPLADKAVETLRKTLPLPHEVADPFADEAVETLLQFRLSARQLSQTL